MMKILMLVVMVVWPSTTPGLVSDGQRAIVVVNGWPATTKVVASVSGVPAVTAPYSKAVTLEAPATSEVVSITGTGGAPLQVSLPPPDGDATETVLVGPASVNGRLASANLITGGPSTPDRAAALRLLAAAPDLAGASTWLDGKPLWAPTPLLSATPYRTISPGQHLVELRTPTGQPLRSLSIDVDPGSAYSVLASGFGEQAVALHLLTDAVGLTALPAGPVRTDGPRAAAVLPWSISLIAVAVDLTAVAMLMALIAVTRARAWIPGALILVLLLLAGCATVATGSPGPSETGSGATGTASTALSASGGPAPPLTSTSAANSRSPSPTARVSSLQLPPNASINPARPTLTNIIELGLTSAGELEVPHTADAVGWYTGSAVPGSPGPAVLAGHESWNGPGVFGRLGNIDVGQLIQIQLTDRTSWVFHVDHIGVYPKDQFPSATVYAPSPRPELRLITCGGRLEQRDGAQSLSDNIVVYAVLN